MYLCFHRFHAVGMGCVSVAYASVNQDTLAPTVKPVSTRRYVRVCSVHSQCAASVGCSWVASSQQGYSLADTSTNCVLLKQ